MQMRWSAALVAALLFPACETVCEEEGVVDATFAGTGKLGVDDPVALQLLGAALAAHATEQRVHSQNIANVNTPGYKRRLVLSNAATITVASGETFAMPEIVAIEPVFTPGVLERTERCLDVAIDGDGFFAVHRLDGSNGYCRDGRLRLNAEGLLCTSRDMIVVPNIRFPDDVLEITIAPDGLVTGRTAGSPSTNTSFGLLTLVRFINPAGLRDVSGLWCETPESGRPIRGQPGLHGLGILRQGFCERSNVELRAETEALQALTRRRAVLEAIGAGVTSSERALAQQQRASRRTR
ncbi:MAG: flagellar hook-basal body complex protein [bacterium]|nr:flagellar hook-basal body complex protein [bacterium]